MERLSIKTPDDFISLMGHTLGYWPKESLVCITLDDRRIGSTLRVGLPKAEADTNRYVQDVVKFIATDREATGVVFGIFTPAPWEPMDDRPYEDVMESLTEELSRHNINVRDGWLIGETSYTSYFQLIPDPLAAASLVLRHLQRESADVQPHPRGRLSLHLRQLVIASRTGDDRRTVSAHARQGRERRRRHPGGLKFLG